MNKIQVDRIQFEKQLWAQGFQRIMGLDEVGRGCLSGPVVASGVIFEPGNIPDGLKDSKLLKKNEREKLVKIIKKTSLFWTIQACKVEEIDNMNILKASLEAMAKCTKADNGNPDYLLVDGNRYVSSLIPHQCIVKGDDKSATIAAASILAKVHRDQLMAQYHEQYPHYGWDTNVGYPTRAHYEGLKKYGYTKLHRQSFNLRTELKYQE